MTPAKHVRSMMAELWKDLPDETMRRTPERVVKALAEMTSGYAEDPAVILGTTFDVGGASDQVVIVRGVRFVSLCEHHLLPFVGTATVGYLPGDRVVGLSKIPRLVECHARRLQLQERLAHDVARDIERHLGARAVAVILVASHACMSCRGVRQPTGEMVTSVMLGQFREDASARSEFLAMADIGG